jgi:hypothetical protein
MSDSTTPKDDSSKSNLTGLLHSIFRANPAFSLLTLDRLEPDEQIRLAPLLQDRDFYGILRSEEPGLGIKSICRDTALLFLTLQSPGRIPSYLQPESDPNLETELQKLVLDGILQVEKNGIFVSGAAALRSSRFHEAVGATTPTGNLSYQALIYAQTLRLSDPGLLSSRLYDYNRLPITPARQQALGSERAVAEFIGIEQGLGAFDHDWAESPNTNGQGYWRYWHRRKATFGGRYKLYLSPHPDLLRDTLWTALETPSWQEVSGFKVGRYLGGIMRPDKFVAYFPSQAALQRAASGLARSLHGIRAHGVPFTASMDQTGLLSWGLDPQTEGRKSWEAPSWRRMLTDRLALGLVAPTGGLEPWQFALERLGLEGVDTQTWTPLHDAVQVSMMDQAKVLA